MTAAKARAYAERIYEELIKPPSIISDQSAELIKFLLANAYLDGAIAEALAALKLLGRSNTKSSARKRGG